MDAYACIMCYRCQQVCPAYNTGKVLSPAALEINKRYLLNFEGGRLAKGEASSQTLTEFAIPPEAVMGLHRLRGVRGYLPGGQRADARYPGYPPLAGADGERVPQAVADGLPRHGAHGQPVERSADRAHEMG